MYKVVTNSDLNSLKKPSLYHPVSKLFNGIALLVTPTLIPLNQQLKRTYVCTSIGYVVICSSFRIGGKYTCAQISENSKCYYV